MSLDPVVQQAVKRTMELGTYSQTAVSRGAGLSTATISQYLKSTPENVVYKGDIDAVQKKLKTWADREAERFMAPRPPPFAPTAISEEITTVLRLAHVERVICVVVGPPGVGKSATIDRYVRQVGDAILLTANPNWDARAILSGICAGMGAPSKGSTWQIADRVMESLTGTGRLIIVDNAEFLKYPALETLRCIQDRARMGLVLCGMQRLYDTMIGRERGLYSHLFSRVSKCTVLSGEVERADVTRIVKSVLPDASDMEMEMFVVIANDQMGGRLRDLVQVLCHLKRTMNTTHQRVSREMIREAGNLLMFRAKN